MKPEHDIKPMLQKIAGLVETIYLVGSSGQASGLNILAKTQYEILDQIEKVIEITIRRQQEKADEPESEDTTTD